MSEGLTMFKTRDECVNAFATDAAIRQCDVVSIFYRPSTDTYRYSPQQRSTSGEQLYAIFEKHVSDNNAWVFREISTTAREDLEKNPLPGKLIF